MDVGGKGYVMLDKKGGLTEERQEKDRGRIKVEKQITVASD